MHSIDRPAHPQHQPGYATLRKLKLRSIWRVSKESRRRKMNEIPIIKNVLRTSTSARQRVQEGRPFPLGATWDGLGVNFALFSANATKVELCLFDIDGSRELERVELPEYTDEVWHGYLPDARPGQV